MLKYVKIHLSINNGYAILSPNKDLEFNLKQTDFLDFKHNDIYHLLNFLNIILDKNETCRVWVTGSCCDKFICDISRSMDVKFCTDYKKSKLTCKCHTKPKG